MHAEFMNSSFYVQDADSKFCHRDSSSKNNAIVKGNGGAIGLTEDPFED